ncbi:proclotting enzyme [Solenopsis invicta]|uniref:proclotting enzyme n=1 Tax=Solenopsis invicta TaxID=13686 RepID=UPI00193CE168|nr:proclotting enzyme [Solenopsis invicta]XP_039315596.1 proclotting enzyme [Solenopsis invicta]XP_039315597.1 proclotting enzyme [Solenopsis invicta]
MAKLCILIALLPQLLCTLVQGQKSPCPQYFTFISKPGTDEVMGQIEIQSPPKTGDLQLKIAFQINAELPSEYVGHLELARSLEESAQAVYEDKNLLYYVHFPLRHVIPTVTGIWFNDQQYCSDHKDFVSATEDIIITITLEHTLTLPDKIPRRYTPSPQTPRPTLWPQPPRPTLSPQTSRPTPSPQTPRPTLWPQPPRPTLWLQTPRPTLWPQTPRPTPSPQTSRPTPSPQTPRPTTSPQTPRQTLWPQPPRPTFWPQTPKPTPISQPTTQKIITNVTLSPGINQNPFLMKWIPAPNSNYKCGVSSRSGHPKYLVVNGDKISPGQWPWLVALFVANKRIEFDFRCGGSILTNQHILTAAHCLKLDLNSNDTFPPNVLIVALGRFNLTHWREKESTNREVANYTIHPHYAHSFTGDSDLAILKLRETVDYNVYIKPICLWSGATNIERTIGQMGYVVGWGLDEDNNRFTEDPRLAKLKIVSRMDCLNNDKSYYDSTSDRTFCAGLSGSTPCSGDSGSGLMIFDYTLQRFHLRGVVSLTISNGPIGTCDPTKFVIFADVAKYLPWIQQLIYPYSNQ